MTPLVRVFLLRHAEAIHDETLELRDPHRHLTLRGREQARCLGERMRWHDCVPTRVWASPLVRAVQTAELVAAALRTACRRRDRPRARARWLAARRLGAAVRALPDDAAVLLVGHEPSLSGVGALLVGARDFEGLAKAQAARIVDGVLRWRFAWDAAAPVVVPAPVSR